MHQNPKIIGQLVQRHTAIKSGERISTIELWPGYGIVCPNLITSNGSARLVAQKLHASMDLLRLQPDLPGYEAQLTIAGEPVSATASEQEIFDLISAAASNSQNTESESSSLL